MVPQIRKTLIMVLAFHRGKANLEKRVGAAKVRVITESLEKDLEDLWKMMAEIQALGKPNTEADAQHPGYVKVKIMDHSEQSLNVPFHLIPAIPDLPILEEVLQLALKVRVGEVDGNRGAICLSGSTIMLRDVMRVGDVDFCEYIPQEVSPKFLAEAFKRQVTASGSRHCTVSIRMQSTSEELDITKIPFDPNFTEQQLEKLCQLVEKPQNGKTSHIVKTEFAGVTEATNWLLMFKPPLENDQVSKMSFAHQEAALNTPGLRTLHSLEPLVAYLCFLSSEMVKHAISHPVKALKRAIPWLRLFGEDALRVELLEKAAVFQVLSCAAVLSKMELLAKYQGLDDLPADLDDLLDSLEEEVELEGQEFFDDSDDTAASLLNNIEEFGRSFAQSPDVRNSPSLLARILSLAEPIVQT